MDHVLFKRLDMSGVGVAHRETVGWIVAQDAESITVIHDRSIITSDGRRDRTPPCGLVLLRALIESIEEVGPIG